MSCIIILRIVPGAKKVRWSRMESGEIKCFVTAPAVDGKANAAIVAALSDVLKIAKSKITILSGHTTRVKRIEIDAAMTEKDLLRILNLDVIQTQIF